MRITRSNDGLPFIYNEPKQAKANRRSTALVPVPHADLEASIDHHARLQALDRRLVQAVIQVESGYNRRARSHKGAMGLMQLTAETAGDLAVSDPYDAEQNLRGGTTYLRRMLDRYDDDLNLALAAYNAGPGAVDRYEGVPPYRETRDYLRRVLSLYRGRPVEIPGVGTVMRAKPQIYVTRDADDRILMTTEPPGQQRRR